MLAFLGFATVIVMLALVMGKKTSPTVALIAVPLVSGIAALAAGVMNIMPWGGPTIRATSAMQMDVMDLFSPMVIPVLTGILSVFLCAAFLGKR